ncbi:MULTISPECIES: TRAP transporter substrate-binding protein DctP [Halomonadaceae]|uniref:TRAP transporter substrate-binding protein DctP n=1 Tax=Vreelandella maris TaxID=2729617 RepID=A0A7Y6V7W6_9GAMM|nr:TRAP transporter substrate-binding protein DctP [Halomonas maris]NVF13948.1 TRAP transporter substrate-binding protein DctP [Halomonas maris]|tara:strand:- start:4224 stop:5228 length:1005 start_codon:yes stop_codon:yes gene_type:complete
MKLLKKSIKHCAIALAVAGTAGTGFSSEVEAQQLNMLAGYPSNFAWYREIGPKFIEMVEEYSDGSVQINVQGPDVVPAFEQLQPVQAGAFDLLFTHAAYHSGTTAIGLSLDAIDVDPIKRREEGLIDYIDEHYQELGLKLISAPSTGTKGFRFYLREPITGEPGLEGRRIRGTVSYQSMIEELGGAVVNMPVTDIYTALQRGVIDGAAWGLTGASDLQWHEIIDYMTDPEFGQVGVMIYMNLDRWNALDSDAQNALIEAGKQIEIDSVAHFDAVQKEEADFLIDNGMQITSFSESESEAHERLWAEGVWKVAEEQSGDDARQLREMAKSADMTY